MDSAWKTHHVKILYGVSGETVRQWSIEFENYLSPTARPGKQKQKMFTDADMQVFALIAQMKREGKNYEDIHTSLKSGQRGETPTMPPGQLSALATSDRERSLQLQLAFVQQELIKAQAALQSIDELEDRLNKERQEKLQIQARYEEVKRTEQELRNQVIELSKQLGREFNEGYKTGLKDARDEA